MASKIRWVWKSFDGKYYKRIVRVVKGTTDTHEEVWVEDLAEASMFSNPLSLLTLPAKFRENGVGINVTVTVEETKCTTHGKLLHS